MAQFGGGPLNCADIVPLFAVLSSGTSPCWGMEGPQRTIWVLCLITWTLEMSIKQLGTKFN